MHREQAKACLEEILKDDVMLDLLEAALSKRRGKPDAAPNPEPQKPPAKPKKATDDE